MKIKEENLIFLLKIDENMLEKNENIKKIIKFNGLTEEKLKNINNLE